jgi:hypothetical protein
MAVLKKISNESSSSPFLARLLFGLLNMRDQLYLMGIQDKQEKQKHFDRKFKPMYEAAQATRDAAIEVEQLIRTHLDAIRSGRAVQFQANQCNIQETIDTPLGQAVGKLIDQSMIATKSCLQDILKDPLELNIGFLFQKDKDFKDGIATIKKAKEDHLAIYLSEVRTKWSSELNALRTLHEHKPWHLDEIKYKPTSPSQVDIILPNINGLSIDKFVRLSANRVLLFIENMTVYAMQRKCQDSVIFVVEIPKEQRDPKDPQRFRLAARGLDNTPPWVLSYSEDMDFV